LFKSCFIDDYVFWSRSAPQLSNDRKKFPKEEWCDRPSSQYDCSYGCQHTQSCQSLFVYSPEEMKLAVEWDSETPDFLTEKSKRERMGKLDGKDKCKQISTFTDPINMFLSV